MNKLVSRNPVLRFKEGRKIIKAEKGLWGKLWDRITDTDLAYIDNPAVMTAAGHTSRVSKAHAPTAEEKQLGNNLAAIGAAGAAGVAGNVLATGEATAILKALPGMQRVLPGRVTTPNVPALATANYPVTINNGLTTGLKILRTIGGSTLLGFPLITSIVSNDSSTKTTGVNNGLSTLTKVSPTKKEYIPLGGVLTMRLKYLGKSNMDIAKEETHNYLEKLRNKYSRPFLKNNPPAKITTPVDNYYLKGFEDRKDEISKLGGVRAVLEKILGFKGNDLDGKWGENTEKAYIKYLISQQPKPNFSEDVIKEKEKNLIIKLPEQINTQPQTPYTTNFDYTGSNLAIRNFGFNNYNGLVNFVNLNPKNLFAKDLLERFGNVNNWNQTKVEGDLGVSGTYRRGASGDYSDIMKSMAAWAGTKNGEADRIRAQKLFDQIQIRPEFNKYSIPSVMSLSYYKQGGNILPSRNIVKRFKLQKGNKFPNAPKAEDRYKDSKRYDLWIGPEGMYNEKSVRTNDLNPGWITQTIRYTPMHKSIDTTYTETPPTLFPVKRLTRIAVRNGEWKRNSFVSNPKEYEILKRRFNTAWNLAK